LLQMFFHERRAQKGVTDLNSGHLLSSESNMLLLQKGVLLLLSSCHLQLPCKLSASQLLDPVSWVPF